MQLSIFLQICYLTQFSAQLPARTIHPLCDGGGLMTDVQALHVATAGGCQEDNIVSWCNPMWEETMTDLYSKISNEQHKACFFKMSVAHPVFILYIISPVLGTLKKRPLLKVSIAFVVHCCWCLNCKDKRFHAIRALFFMGGVVDGFLS